MNAILAYAIEHEADAKRLLAGYYHVPPDDVDDLHQEMLLRILKAAPSADSNVKGYWSVCLANRVRLYFRSRRPLIGLDDWTLADPLQDPETAAIRREDLREAWDVSTPAQRRAIVARLRGQPDTPAGRVAIVRLKRRLGLGVYDRTMTCKSGHPWRPESTYISPSGWRRCRPCNNIRARARYHPPRRRPARVAA